MIHHAKKATVWMSVHTVVDTRLSEGAALLMPLFPCGRFWNWLGRTVDHAS
jgi:hypothetical protein